jgi:hypothetical protein
MSVTRTLRQVLALAPIVLVAGCMLPSGGAHDPEKTMLYVNLVVADLALQAEDSFRTGEGWQELGAEVKVMQGAAQTLPAGSSRTPKVAALVAEAGRTVAIFETAMPDVALGYVAERSLHERAPQLLASWEEVIRGMGDSGAPASQVQIANRQVVLVERMAQRATEAMAGGDRGVSAADALSRDQAVYSQVLDGMQKGNPELGLERVASSRAQAALTKLQALQVTQAGAAEALLKQVPAVQSARQAADHLRSIRSELMEAAPPRY